MTRELMARAESATGELTLTRVFRDRAEVLELRANGVFVMDDTQTASEVALAGAALAQVPDPRAVLVGGLGLGFTAQAVLADPRVTTCTVVEIEPALVQWFREGLVPHGPQLLARPGLDVVVADIAAFVRERLAAGDEGRPAAYDAVLLDVDNGPGYLVHEANAALYEGSFLSDAMRLLRAGGALVIWSAAREPGLLATLAALTEDVAEISVPVRLNDRDEAYWLYRAIAR